VNGSRHSAFGIISMSLAGEGNKQCLPWPPACVPGMGVTQTGGNSPVGKPDMEMKRLPAEANCGWATDRRKQGRLPAQPRAWRSSQRARSSMGASFPHANVKEHALSPAEAGVGTGVEDHTAVTFPTRPLVAGPASSCMAFSALCISHELCKVGYAISDRTTAQGNSATTRPGSQNRSWFR
jgi:hypothetical protein